ncbi:MAG: hypothetical protein KGS72_19285 [Cyanobacteria bacterium REEB67]|nr:hypothetical protein [Cyanobacteria bacterium REEB67]
MDPNAFTILATIAGGFILAIGCDLFGRKSTFAKEHGTITFFAGLILVGIAAYISILVNRQGGSWLLPLVGFFVMAKISESRDKRVRARTIQDKWLVKVNAILAARAPGEAVEIDVNGAPDTVFWYIVNTNTKKGLKVESIKDLTNGGTRLRFSDPTGSPEQR